MSIDLGNQGYEGANDSLFETSPAQTIIVLDWDDTILPTTWLERNRVLGTTARLRPAMQNQLTALSQAADITIRLCQQLGTVIFITNSCPGWMDNSCHQFMPSLLPFVRSIPIYAKPMTAHGTFKFGAFQAQCANFTNVISIGDGIAERTAVLRLVSPNMRAKSIKFRDMPSLVHMHHEHMLLQKRLAKVVGFWGNLDLRIQFTGKGEEKTLLVHIAKVADPVSRKESLENALPRMCTSGRSKPTTPLTSATNKRVIQPARRPAPDARYNRGCDLAGICSSTSSMRPQGTKTASNSCGAIPSSTQYGTIGRFVPQGLCHAWQTQPSTAPSNVTNGRGRAAAYTDKERGCTRRIPSDVHGSNPEKGATPAQLPRINLSPMEDMSIRGDSALGPSESKQHRAVVRL